MNKKVISQLGAALILTGVVACSSSSETTRIEPVKLEQDPNLCYFDDTEVRAPDWICGTPVEGYPVAAVGSFRDTKAGTSFARNQATMDGRVQLATEMKAKVGAMVKTMPRQPEWETKRLLTQLLQSRSDKSLQRSSLVLKQSITVRVLTGQPMPWL